MSFQYDHSANFGIRPKAHKQKPKTLRETLVQVLSQNKRKINAKAPSEPLQPLLTNNQPEGKEE